MATTEPIPQQLMAMQNQSQQLQQQLIQVMQHQSNQQSQQSQIRAGRLTDLRVLGGPPVFGGDDDKYREWMSKLVSFVATKWSTGLPWLSWATEMRETINEEDIDLEFGDNSPEVKLFSAELQQLLCDRTQGAAWDIAHSGGEGNGLESFRQLKRRFEPRTAGTKLKQLICIGSATKVDEVELKARHMEDLIKRYKAMSGTIFPEDLKVKVLIYLCSKELMEHTELNNKDLDYKSAREEILKFLERKREIVIPEPGPSCGGGRARVPGDG